MGKIRKKDLENQSSSLMILGSGLLIIMMFCCFGLMNAKGTYSATTLECPTGGYKSVSSTKCCLDGYDFDGTMCFKTMNASSEAECRENCGSASCKKNGGQWSCTSYLSAQDKIEKETCTYKSVSACQSATGYLCNNNSSGCWVPTSTKLNEGCYKCSKSDNNYSLQWSSVEVSGCSKVDVAQSSCSGTHCNDGYELKDGACVKKEYSCYTYYKPSDITNCETGLRRVWIWTDTPLSIYKKTAHDESTCKANDKLEVQRCLPNCDVAEGYVADSNGKCVIESKFVCYKCPNEKKHNFIYKWSSTLQNGCYEVNNVPAVECSGTYCEAGYVKDDDGNCVKHETPAGEYTITFNSAEGVEKCRLPKPCNTTNGKLDPSCIPTVCSKWSAVKWDEISGSGNQGSGLSISELKSKVFTDKDAKQYYCVAGSSNGCSGTPGYDPDIPVSPDEPDTPDNPSNPDNPSEPSNPDNPSNPDKDENVTENPKTGSVAIFVCWVIALATIVYAFWYFKKAKYE